MYIVQYIMYNTLSDCTSSQDSQKSTPEAEPHADSLK